MNEKLFDTLLRNAGAHGLWTWFSLILKSGQERMRS